MVPVRRHARDWRTYFAGGRLVLVEKWRQTFYILIVIIAIFASFDNSERFQKCIRENKHQKTYHALYEKTTSAERLIVRIRLTANCASGDTDVLTALAGIVVAFFTFTLWVSTYRLWKAGENQIAVAREATQAAKTSAQAALATIDRPYLHVTSLNYTTLQHLGNPGTNSYVTTNITVCIKNVGRSPAVVLATRYVVAVRNRFITNFEFIRDNSSSFHKEPTLVLSGEDVVTTGHLCGTLYIKDASKNSSHFRYYVIGQIDYIDPIRLDRRVKGFLYYMPQGIGIATTIYNPAYDYDRIQERPSDPDKHANLTLPNEQQGRGVGPVSYPT